MPEATTSARVRRALSPRNIGAIYIFIALFVLFALWVPDTFLTKAVWRTLLDQGALTAMVAMALVLPLAAGAFNLAIGAELGFGAILVAWLLAKQDVPVVPAIAGTVAVGCAIGAISGLLITRARIDSFIATLGMSSVLLAGISWVSGSQQILNLGSSFSDVATGQLLGLTYPVWMMLMIALVLWYVTDRTAVGRRLHATGGNEAAARLAGVRTSRVIVLALVACGGITAFAGTLATARIATGDPTIGPAYLLPAYAAAFLGSTQFRGGRYNIWGTVVAVYVLATGVKGLQLAGAPVWIPDLFNGLALLLAVGMAKFQGTARRGGAVGRMLARPRTRSGADQDSTTQDQPGAGPVSVP
ncbi:MAG TPA: ABC transporter permease [Baekduia sp.]